MVLVAMVAMGAAACTNDQVESVGPTEEGVSFYAEFVNNDGTRAYIDDTDGDKTWNTIWEQGDILQVSADAVKFYIFEYDSEKGKFTCNTEGVTSLVGQTVDISAYLGGNLNSKAGKKAWNCQGTKVDNFATSDEPVQFTANTSFLRYTYDGDGDVTFSIKGTNDRKVFVYDDYVYHDEVTISGVKGENFVAFWIQDFSLEATLSYSIGGVECKTANLNLTPGKIYNLGTLSKLSDWSVVGAFNSWDQTANQMYLEGNAFVARNITFDASGLKLCYNNWENEVGVYQEYGQELDPVTVGDWYLSKYKTDGYKSNITVTDTSKKYDIYLLNDTTHAYFCVVESGTKVTVPSGGWGICGSFTGWGEQKDIKLTKEGDKYVATNVEIPAGAEFKFRYNNNWDLDQKGLSEEDSATAITVGEAIDVTGTQNIKVATAGTYDIYLTTDFSVFAVVNAGDGYPVEPFKIYVYNYAEWSPLNIYAWTTGEVSAAWPGDAITATEVINGYTYYVYTIPVGANDKTLNIIFNNGSMQISDYELGVVNKDYYLRLEGISAPVVIEDINNPEPEVVVEKVARTITVNDNTGSTSLHLYWWVGGTGWPGDEMTKNGTTYTYTFDKSLDGMTVNMIFNNGSGKQTANIENIVLDKNYTFTLNSDWSYTQN